MHKNNDLIAVEKQDLRLSDATAVAIVNGGGIVDVTEATVRWFSAALKLLVDEIGDLPVTAVSPQQLQHFQLIVAQRATAKTANNYVRAVRTVYGRLLKKRLVISNPAAYVPNLPEPPARRPKAIKFATYQRLLRVADSSRNAAMLAFLWGTGARVGEMISLRLPAVELWPGGFAAEIRGKGDKIRHVYARDGEADLIADYYHERPSTLHDAFFITYEGAPLKSFVPVLRKLQRLANLPPGTISNAHAFRHAFALRMLDSGYDLPTVSAWLGHSDPAFTAKTYVIRDETELRSLYFK